MKAKGLVLWLVIILGYISKVISSVFDFKHAQVISSASYSPNHCFGYALDFAKDNKGQPWIVVGAPKDSYLNTEESGTIQACSLDSTNNIQCKLRYPNNLVQDSNNSNPLTELAGTR